MGHTCSRCSRVNPAEAQYCYFDGSALPIGGGQVANNGGARAAGPIKVGAQPFANKFVFPSGQVCQTFDQLAMGCQQNWSAAADMLAQGYFETFLAGLGRADLGQAARKAAKFPDRDRGLDQLLGELPTDVLKPPKLQVEPLEINLGTMRSGEDRQLELNLNNAGMRLLYGSVTCENTPWLTLGKLPGTQQKLFKFGKDQTIPLNVIGKNLRAGSKPLEGRLVIESNGGQAVVMVRCNVPAKPFPNGVLAGATSPRQAAEKAKAKPKEAASLFESGAVAEWYKSNGWVYPVRGPASTGLGAVQQFFEALGLTPPPKVEISPRTLNVQGKAGQRIDLTLEVKATEKRPVYAHATSDQDWMKVERARLNGRVATIPIVVTVPENQGDALNAKVRIMANGNQRFIVPVSLSVAGAFAFGAVAGPVGSNGGGSGYAAAGRSGAGAAAAAAAPIIGGGGDGGSLVSVPSTYARRRQQGSGLHWLPAAALVACLIGVVTVEAVMAPAKTEDQVAKKKEIDDLINGPDGGAKIDQNRNMKPGGNKLLIDDPNDLKDTRPRIAVAFQDLKRRFGIVMTEQRDPTNEQKFKRLTYQENGANNNTCIKIDNAEYLFGFSPGKWVKDDKKKEMDLVEIQPGRRWKSVMDYPEGIRVTQLVQIVAGDVTKVLDTCLVIYEIENRSTIRRSVGVRALIDTFIGSEDGTPFAIPGTGELVDTKKDIPQKDIPDFIQALERGDPSNPGVAAQIGLKISGLEPMLMVRLCHWPDEIGSEVRWDWADRKLSPNSKGIRAMNDPPDGPKDSCVTMYWSELPMAPKERRVLGYTYGLGRVSAPVETKQDPTDTATTPTPAGTVKLALTSGGNMSKGQTFTVMAYVKNPQPGHNITLRLPAGLALDTNEAENKPVVKDPTKTYAQVSWKVKANEAGPKHLEADLKTGTTKLATATDDVVIKVKGVFDN